MNNHISMQASSFELKKNIKASGYTIAICSILAFLFFFIQWNSPQISPPIADTGIEVNLGNSETGLGNIAPQLPGTPSTNAQQNQATPTPSAAIPSKATISASDNGDEAINTTSTPNSNTKPINTPDITKKKSVNTTTVVSKPSKPKALYKAESNKGNGGNYADSYNGINNQGITGGKGDQGKPNGNPNSDSYTGNGGFGNSGVSIRSGLDGRKFTQFPSFQDDFNEPAKVAVDITVDINGNVMNATINPRGTTTTNYSIRAIAIRKAKQLKLNSGKEDQQTGTIVFDFKLKG